MLDKRDRLGELEGVIERGLKTFVEVGNAIREIRDSRLYKESHETFEAYCRERWGWSRSYAYRQVEAASTAELLPIGNTPPNEAQARELAPIAKEDPETARRVWGGLTEEHGEDLTAKHVKKAVEEVKAARSIREQLPPATKTIIEGSDPDDTPLSRSPKQLTHLSDIARARGDEKASEVAERVANGEFKSTFEAYPEVKAEAVELPSEKGQKVFQSLMQRLHEMTASVDQAGGLAEIIARWPEKNRGIFVSEYRSLAERALRQAEDYERSGR